MTLSEGKNERSNIRNNRVAAAILSEQVNHTADRGEAACCAERQGKHGILDGYAILAALIV